MSKTMTLNLPEREMEVLEQLCSAKDMSKTAIMKQALRLYQLVDKRLSAGDELAFIDAAGTTHRVMPLMAPSNAEVKP